jgi:hypothetical protein
MNHHAQPPKAKDCGHGIKNKLSAWVFQDLLEIFVRIGAESASAKAVAEHPEKSNRTIATDLGVSLDTVNRARKATDRNRSVDEKEPPIKRIGNVGCYEVTPASR